MEKSVGTGLYFQFERNIGEYFLMDVIYEYVKIYKIVNVCNHMK